MVRVRVWVRVGANPVIAVISLLLTITVIGHRPINLLIETTPSRSVKGGNFRASLPVRPYVRHA